MSTNLGSMFTGALGGYGAGGWLGAGAGLLGGAFDRQSRSMPILAPYEGGEAGLRSQGGAVMRRGLDELNLSPEARQAYIDKMSNALYQPMKRQATEGFHKGMATNRVANARGGMLGSSAALRGDMDNSAALGGVLSDAQYKSLVGGDQMFLGHQANSRANVDSGRGVMGQMEQQRLARSGMFSDQPNSSYGTGLGLLGMGVGMKSPYLDKANNWISSKMGIGGGGGGGVTAKDFSTPTSALAWNFGP